jgi:hypothetical protein
MNLLNLAKILIIIGISIALIGAILFIFAKIPFLSKIPGKLPGDIVIQRKNFTFYFPLATSIIISLVLSLVLTIIFRFFINK